MKFVQSVVDNLPSSSQASTKPSHVSVFSEHLLDMIWSLDVELDEILADAKVAITNCGDQAAASGSNLSSLFSKANKAKENAEKDKETISKIVKKFLVCRQMFYFGVSL